MNLLNLILAIVVTAQLDSAQLMIGDQCDLHLQATREKSEQLYFPVFGEELIPGIEIVDRTIVDTVNLKDGRVQMNQYLTITSFKDSLFVIDPLPFVAGTDTIYSDPLTLNILQPFVIDTTQNAITDIKPVYRAPIWWWGIIGAVLILLLIAALAVGLYFLIRYLKKRKKAAEQPIVDPELLRPAEEVALEKLDKIKEDKIWQQGRYKDYHTDLTDVVREYISRRFNVYSVEKTSDETLDEIQPLLKEQKDLFLALKQMLHLADLVKFAKWQPTPDENEQSLRDAYRFVNETTPQTPEEQMADEPAKEDNNKTK